MIEVTAATQGLCLIGPRPVSSTTTMMKRRGDVASTPSSGAESDAVRRLWTYVRDTLRAPRPEQTTATPPTSELDLTVLGLNSGTSMVRLPRLRMVEVLDISLRTQSTARSVDSVRRHPTRRSTLSS